MCIQISYVVTFSSKTIQSCSNYLPQLLGNNTVLFVTRLSNVTVCDMQCLGASVQYIWCIYVLPQIKTLTLETNDTQVLQADQNKLKTKIIDNERDMWKTKIDEMITIQSVTEKEVHVLVHHRCCVLYITNNNCKWNV